MALEVPTTTQIELKKEKLDEESLRQVLELNNNLNESLLKIGQMTMRQRELQTELEKTIELFEEAQEDSKQANKQLNQFLEKLDKKYPGMRLDLSTGEITYQANQ